MQNKESLRARTFDYRSDQGLPQLPPGLDGQTSLNTYQRFLPRVGYAVRHGWMGPQRVGVSPRQSYAAPDADARAVEAGIVL